MKQEWACKKCHKIYEIEVEEWEDVVLTCPNCGGMNFERRY